MNKQGYALSKVPLIGGRELDLCWLFQAVVSRGGLDYVSNNKLWKDIVAEFSLPQSCTSASFTLKNHYLKYLYLYEQKVHFKKEDSEINRGMICQPHTYRE